MSKPTNFSYSNNLISTRQPIADNKGSVFVKGNPIGPIPAGPPKSTPSSAAIMGGMSRPSVNVGHAPGTSAESNYNHAKDFIGATGMACVQSPFPMKHWRRQLAMNGKSGRSAASVEISNRPGGTSFRGYHFNGDSATGKVNVYYDNVTKSWRSSCNCDASGNNIFITFDNKLLQNTSKSIKPPAVVSKAPIGSGGGGPGTRGQGQVGNKIYNPGYVQIGPVDANGSYQIQTGVYNIKNICCTPENQVIKSANTNLSQSYYNDSRGYLKSRGKLYAQKLSIMEISGNEYIYSDGKNKGKAIPPSDSSTGSQVFQTNNCPYPYQTGKNSGCNTTIYKRSNPHFATQGAVDNGTRLAKLKYDTITLNGNSFRSAWGQSAANAGKYHGDFNGTAPYFIKSKYTPPMAWRRRGNKQVCNGCTGGPRTVLSSFWGGV
jgi:hypothetical protein